MLRRTVHALAASLLLAAGGANAALEDLPDGTSNTVLLPELELTESAALSGVGKLKVGDTVRRGAGVARIDFDPQLARFTLLLAEDQLFTGRLVAVGAGGDRFKAFLDADSRDRFAAHVARSVGPEVDARTGAVLGETLAFELTLDESLVRLKLKAEVLTAGFGLVILKANLSGVSGPVPER
jgi:hypothetical protein